jgi:putative membrane protein
VKLDPRSIPYRVLQQGSAFFVIALFAVVGPSASQGVWGLVGGLVVALLVLGVVAGWQVAYHRRYEYDLTPDTFDITSGVLSRRRREIPYRRVQNVDIAQNPVQRFMGIAEVRLETAGGSESEARLRYVSSEEAERLQDEVGRRKRRESATTEAEAAAAEQAPAEEELFELQDSELWILGAVTADLRLLGVVASFAPFVLPTVFDEIDPSLVVLLAGGGALLLVSVLGLWVVSGVYAVLRYYGFRLFRRGDELRYERGLLQRYSGSIPLEKVQTVSLAENVLARRLGYASVRIGTAGYAPGQTQGQRVQSAVPIAERDRALSLARQVEPFGDLDFERPPTRARWRYGVRYSLVVLGIVAVLAGANVLTGQLPFWPVGLLLFAVVPPAAHLKWANLGYHLGDDHVVTRKGFWVRKTTVVPYHRVQTVLRSRTVFQRRRDLGTVVVDTAAGGGLRGSDAVALDIDAGRATSILEIVDERLQTALAERRADADRSVGEDRTSPA